MRGLQGTCGAGITRVVGGCYELGLGSASLMLAGKKYWTLETLLNTSSGYIEFARVRSWLLDVLR